MASRKAPAKRAHKGRSHAAKEADRWVGQPVCVVLNDGSCYVGTVQAVHDRKLILSGTRDCGKVNLSGRSKAPEVQVAGLLDSLIGGIGALNSFGSVASGLFKPMLSDPSGFSGAGSSAGPANQTGSASLEGPLSSGPEGGGQPGGEIGFFGSLKQMLPTFQVGLQMVKTIMPLIGAFKI